ncbi:Hypotetical protein [Gulosibacter molinativorax]|nr:hypothetical protein [Gulosibacter molinativorax]QUY61238.1 Hypotetical protein [Gulosibacter molinativorax]
MNNDQAGYLRQSIEAEHVARNRLTAGKRFGHMKHSRVTDEFIKRNLVNGSATGDAVGRRVEVRAGVAAHGDGGNRDPVSRDVERPRDRHSWVPRIDGGSGLYWMAKVDHAKSACREKGCETQAVMRPSFSVPPRPGTHLHLELAHVSRAADMPLANLVKQLDQVAVLFQS